MHRIIALVCLVISVAACTNPNDLDEAPAPLGDFALGHNVVVTPNITKGPASRDASDEEWIAAMTSAIDERFSRYEGDKLYHIGISIEGYVLAVPGVPLVASPKSALILNATVWDDAAGKKLNEKPEQITVIESFSGETMLGSGLTQSKEDQMRNLSRNAAKLIQNWMVRQKYQEDWFGGTEADRRLRAEARAEAKAAKAASEAAEADAELPEEG
ncbi:hypothetical protein [Roseovarius aquimarinus]|uniref:Lipoprotein n=1 Tax=Roseovarius aquimarinus TaxID=1229156 RepID=A0ABW7I7P9_9RHOB